MPDRSSSQGLPDDWNRGSHAARGQHSRAAASDAYGAGTTGPYRARTADIYGAEATEAYGAGEADAFGARPAATYGVKSADPFGPLDADPFGTRNADPFGGAAADAYGTAADTYGAAPVGVYAAGRADGGTARSDAEAPATAVLDAAPSEATGSKGFLGALFDFGFTSFVTPKVIKVLYVLIMIGTVASALVFTVMAFKVSAVFGFLTLIIGDPLFILIVMAIFRIILEFFVVAFRVADDVRALRERGDLG
jgi:hypothetical protein